MKYRLLFPKLDEGHRVHGMLDYLSNEKPRDAEPYEIVYEGDVEWKRASQLSTYSLLEFLWQRHNVGDEADDNRPRPQEIRSMCIGDIIIIDDGTQDGEWWIAQMTGFTKLIAADYPSIKAGGVFVR